MKCKPIGYHKNKTLMVNKSFEKWNVYFHQHCIFWNHIMFATTLGEKKGFIVIYYPMMEFRPWVNQHSHCITNLQTS
jgi:hypothetical protein